MVAACTVMLTWHTVVPVTTGLAADERWPFCKRSAYARLSHQTVPDVILTRKFYLKLESGQRLS